MEPAVEQSCMKGYQTCTEDKACASVRHRSGTEVHYHHVTCALILMHASWTESLQDSLVDRSAPAHCNAHIINKKHAQSSRPPVTQPTMQMRGSQVRFPKLPLLHGFFIYLYPLNLPVHPGIVLDIHFFIYKPCKSSIISFLCYREATCGFSFLQRQINQKNIYATLYMQW